MVFLKFFFSHHFNSLPLNIVLCKIVMYRGYVDSVVVLGFRRQLFNDWLSLRHVTGSPNLANGKTYVIKDFLLKIHLNKYRSQFVLSTKCLRFFSPGFSPSYMSCDSFHTQLAIYIIYIKICPFM